MLAAILVDFCLCKLHGFGFAGESVIFELYSEKPIAADCAKRTIERFEIVRKAWLDNYAIKLMGDRFSGKLCHDGENETFAFTAYGMEIEVDPVFGVDDKDIVDRITDKIHSECAK